MSCSTPDSHPRRLGAATPSLGPPGMDAQAQRARGVLAREVVGAMEAARVDAFVGNASEQLAMANLAGLPTMAAPVALAVRALLGCSSVAAAMAAREVSRSVPSAWGPHLTTLDTTPDVWRVSYRSLRVEQCPRFLKVHQYLTRAWRIAGVCWAGGPGASRACACPPAYCPGCLSMQTSTRS